LIVVVVAAAAVVELFVGDVVEMMTTMAFVMAKGFVVASAVVIARHFEYAVEFAAVAVDVYEGIVDETCISLHSEAFHSRY
jgi:hypothetical protein